MWCPQVCKRTIAQASSPRGILVAFMIITFVYIVVYLLWTSPASQKRQRNRVQAMTGKKTGMSLPTRPGASSSQHVNGHIIGSSKGVWVSGRHIQIMSAIHDLHHANVSEYRYVFPVFLRHSSNRNFVCCFHAPGEEDFIQIAARLDYIDLRFIVELQNAAFDCSVPGHNVQEERLSFVSFAPEMCGQNMSQPIAIIYPQRRSWEFAVCTKVAYARLDPSRLVEWFEYMRVIGASKIMTFHNNLHPDSRRVLDYYALTGYLELIEYNPRKQEGHPSIIYTERNSQTRQARHDKTLVVRDCQYRLAGYDFILTIDFDELPVPLRPYGSLNWVLQALQRNLSQVAGFRMDPVLMPPEWHDDTPDLYHWQFSKGTYIAPYCVKWAYIPSRTWLAATHEIVPKEGYHMYVIPQDILHFLHFRQCKSDWREVPCENLTMMVTNEFSLKRFAGGVLQNMRKLPLEELILDKKYVAFVRQDPRGLGESRRWNPDDTLLNF